MIYGVAIALFLVFMTIFSLYVRGIFGTSLTPHLIGLPAHVSHFATTLASWSDSHATKGEMTQFWQDIEVIQSARLGAIAQAQSSIQFETFIITPGQRAEAFQHHLCERAAAGVQVQILADSYGAKAIAPNYWQTLKDAGVEVKFFNRFSWRDPVSYLRRNHRKLLIIDQKLAMIGGAGMSDLWDGAQQSPPVSPWLDFEVQWRGELVGFLTGLFWQHWRDAGGVVNFNQHQPFASKSDSASPIVVTPGEDPTRSASSIQSLLQFCILSAQQRLWIASPYLLPAPTTCQQLIKACQQGVDVRILTMGPRNDKPYVYFVSRERYEPLLKAGIKIHEYQPSMMHAKVILVDDHWISLGSANLDPRSFFHNDELNLCTNHPALHQQIDEFFRIAFEKSTCIQLAHWRDRPLRERLYGKLSSIAYWQL